jgi:hypothetical protein
MGVQLLKVEVENAMNGWYPIGICTQGHTLTMVYVEAISD